MWVFVGVGGRGDGYDGGRAGVDGGLDCAKGSGGLMWVARFLVMLRYSVGPGGAARPVLLLLGIRDTH